MLLMAAYFHGDQLTGINMIGLLLCFGGIGLHVYTKTTKSGSSVPESQAKHQQRP